jgi:hypothetical protein
VQWRPVDEVVGIDAGVAAPVQRREIGKSDRGQDHERLDAARVQDRVEPFDAHAVLGEFKLLDLETETGSAAHDARHDRRTVALGVFRPVRRHHLDRGDHTAEFLTA